MSNYFSSCLFFSIQRGNPRSACRGRMCRTCRQSSKTGEELTACKTSHSVRYQNASLFLFINDEEVQAVWCTGEKAEEEGR